MNLTTNTRGTALITGASNGIGLELARKMLTEGWEVIALVRSRMPESDAVIGTAVKENRLRTYHADLSDFDSLRAALEQIKAKESKIDVLFNNAGGSFDRLMYSKQGREMHYELQTVVPYIIYMELKELLRRGSQRTVVNTSTAAFRFVKNFNPESLDRPSSFRKLIGPYAESKLALSLWTRELGPAALAEEGIRLRSADPGGNNTLRKDKPSGLPLIVKLMMKMLMSPPSKGASLLYDAALGNHRGETGVYLSKGNIAALKYTEHGDRVLEKVKEVYEREYLAVPVS
ncbi:SDR family NAD(P)-dependent oxidoreductase [Paenibacillus sp. CN-4]|uniref:SDR family NAD(P)-dependent oxidoreductase n=1 Tax=Paenibacillus nanchangensis TaxID=3348343 RepID=UPI00397C5BA7